MPVQGEVSHTIKAPVSVVWKILNDEFVDIAQWNSSLRSSRAIGTKTSGVGARRQCAASPFGSLDETVLEVEPEEKFTIAIDRTAMLPLKEGVTTFKLFPKGNATEVVVQAEAEAKGFWPISRLLTVRLRKIVPRGLKDLLMQLGEEAEKRARSVSATSL